MLNLLYLHFYFEISFCRPENIVGIPIIYRIVAFYGNDITIRYLYHPITSRSAKRFCLESGQCTVSALENDVLHVAPSFVDNNKYYDLSTRYIVTP